MSEKFLHFSRPTLTEEMGEAIKKTLLSLQITSGPQVQAFEKALSTYHGDRPARVFTSATAAMEIAFQICKIGAASGGRGTDEVITSAMTFFSVGNMIEKAGARTVFVDCDLTTRNIDLDQVERAISLNTRAIVPTHFSGLPCDMDQLYALASKHKLRVIEDAALAIGSSWKGRKIGAFGDIATFSFHPNKNMTTIEGGALVVNDADEAARVERLRFHGIRRNPDGTRDVEVAGGKYNLSDVAARLGLAQLEHLSAWCSARARLAELYFEAFADDELLPPERLPLRENPGHSWNMFTVLLPLGQMAMDRKAFMDALHAEGIGTGLSYEAVHLTTLFRSRGWREGRFPVAERIGRETVTLPLFPEMTESDVARVAGAVRRLLRTNPKP